MNSKYLLLFTFCAIASSCKLKKIVQSDFNYKQIEKISDSIVVDNITVHNLFKYQILAHKKSKFDSLMIQSKVYLPHKSLWDNCYGSIFGEENSYLFNNKNGMIKWNKILFKENKQQFVDHTKEITSININHLLRSNLEKFNRLVPYKPTAKVSMLFTPITGIGFGGCSSMEFAFEINNESLDLRYTLEKGFAHELNHFVYEQFRNNDSERHSALSQTIDEGFACYFTYIFFDKKITEYEAVENMTREEWSWFIENEKEIFLKSKIYFSDNSGNNPLLRNEKFKLFPKAPKTLNYWLGYRIVSKYVEEYGEDSWKDIYELTAKEVFEKSKYEQYINNL
ncbi:Predicted Zn-dependent protease [Paenimyroides ummariense]|uniref:Predicted Zn-dependent protease n=1 Tax=Paenimyroides ummariense TaxID=913024 RepID=A0A1I5CT05_9FLAO|nr:DUF2268 domain-containing putative Zn-dependent protease [Paenimyroides ummariense]SFN90125.1 Predicted Zn-dependent protease [Paenimyroides ummariense]